MMYTYLHTSTGLVTHENTDISIATLGCLGELTDPDAVLEAEKEASTLIDSLVVRLIAHSFYYLFCIRVDAAAAHPHLYLYRRRMD